MTHMIWHIWYVTHIMSHIKCGMPIGRPDTRYQAFRSKLGLEIQMRHDKWSYECILESTTVPTAMKEIFTKYKNRNFEGFWFYSSKAFYSIYSS